MAFLGTLDTQVAVRLVTAATAAFQAILERQVFLVLADGQALLVLAVL